MARPPTVIVAMARRGTRAGIAVGAAGLCIAVLWQVLAAAPPDERVVAALIDVLVVGVPMSVGLLAWRAQPDERFARMLVAVGACFGLVALAHAQGAFAYSVGRIAVWLIEPLVLGLMLVFPSGRVTSRGDRRLIAGLVALVGVLYLPTVLIAQRFPEPSPWASCGVDCPENAFAVAHVDAAVLDAIRIVREVLTVLLVGAVATSVAARARRSPALLRRALAPVVVVAAFQVVAFAAYQWHRRNGDVSETVELIGQVWTLSVPLVALSFAVGLLHRRLHVASAMQRLTWRLRAPATAHELRDGLADVLEDPGLRIVYWLSGEPGRWVDESGWPAKAPAAAEGRTVTEVEAEGRPIAAVVHDTALAPDSKLVEAAATYALVVLENTRLIDELRSSLRRLSESEDRRSAAVRTERLNIERDLHDGAQQRLLALRINLSLLAERLHDDAPGRAAELEELGGHVDLIIEDMRELAHSSSPLLLSQAGLPAALRAEALVVPLPVRVHDGGVGRYTPEIERTVYFACMEAVQNAVKHAHGASGIAIDFSAGHRLHFEVRDDGPGFDGAARPNGSGLANMTHRLASIGGQLDIESAPGRGTRVVGSVPIG